MSRIALLDVSLLIALFDPDHVHHEAAHDWFADHDSEGWATCPLSQNGFVRILSNPRYPAEPWRPADLLDHLRQFCAHKRHVWWPDSISLTDARYFNVGVIRGHRQISDIYLLGLAKKMGGYLATFDSGIPIGAVIGATRNTLAVICPDMSEP